MRVSSSLRWWVGGLVLCILLAWSLTEARAKPAPVCPRMQAGVVAYTLPSEGVTIILVDYPCDWAASPVLVASPSGQGAGWVTKFESNPLTGGEGSIAVWGEPGGTGVFQWVAVQP